MQIIVYYHSLLQYSFKTGLTGRANFVDVVSPLLGEGDLVPDLVQLVQVYVSI